LPWDPTPTHPPWPFIERVPSSIAEHIDEEEEEEEEEEDDDDRNDEGSSYRYEFESASRFRASRSHNLRFIIVESQRSLSLSIKTGLIDEGNTFASLRQGRELESTSKCDIISSPNKSHAPNISGTRLRLRKNLRAAGTVSL
jgi:hypothetical protein